MFLIVIAKTPGVVIVTVGKTPIALGQGISARDSFANKKSLHPHRDEGMLRGTTLFVGNDGGVLSSRPHKRRGGAEGTRTHDPHNAIVVLSQLSYCPTLWFPTTQRYNGLTRRRLLPVVTGFIGAAPRRVRPLADPFAALSGSHRP